MSKEQFDAAYRAFWRRRPFRGFFIEFTSGQQLLVGHPEAVRKEADLYGASATTRKSPTRKHSEVGTSPLAWRETFL
jgi:hypothetical protein